MLFGKKPMVKTERLEENSRGAIEACRRSGFDRRAGEDRRQVHDINYLAVVGRDRRSGGERRKTGELREGWVRVNQWSSVCVEEASLSRRHADEPFLYAYEIR